MSLWSTTWLASSQRVLHQTLMLLPQMLHNVMYLVYVQRALYLCPECSLGSLLLITWLVSTCNVRWSCFNVRCMWHFHLQRALSFFQRSVLWFDHVTVSGVREYSNLNPEAPTCQKLTSLDTTWLVSCVTCVVEKFPTVTSLLTMWLEWRLNVDFLLLNPEAHSRQRALYHLQRDLYSSAFHAESTPFT